MKNKKNKEKKMTKKQQEERLAELYARIEREVEFIDIKPYSHNIISLNLRIICKEFGYNKANKTIDKFSLTSLGFNKEYEKPKTNKSKVRSSK